MGSVTTKHTTQDIINKLESLLFLKVLNKPINKKGVFCTVVPKGKLNRKCDMVKNLYSQITEKALDNALYWRIYEFELYK